MRYSVEIWIPFQTEDDIAIRVDLAPPCRFGSMAEALRYINVYRCIWRIGLGPGEPRLIGVVIDSGGRVRRGLGFGCQDTSRHPGRKYSGRIYSERELKNFWEARGTTIVPFEPPKGETTNETHDMTDRADSVREGVAA